MSTSDPDPVDVCAASEVRPEVLDWLWPGRLALGKVALLEGDPGLGKSLVALDLCARLSIGRSFPEGPPLPGPASAIYLSAEDAAHDILVPRLRALGADLDRVFVHARKDLLQGQAVVLPNHLGFLDAVLTRTGARLLVLDPIVAYLAPSVNVSSEPSVRRALAPLAALAQQHSCVVLLIRHLNKKSGGRMLYRGAHSLAFLAACRSAWLFAAEPQAADATEPVPRRVLMLQQKNNLDAPQPGLAFELRAGAGGWPTVHWLGPCAWTMEQLTARPRRERRPVAARACRFLKKFLADGPRLTQDIWVAAQEKDLNKKALDRARKKLKLETRHVVVGGQRCWYWKLDKQTWPSQVELEQAEVLRDDAELAAILRGHGFPVTNPATGVVAAADAAPAVAPAASPAAPLADSTAPAATAPGEETAPVPGPPKPRKPLPQWMVDQGWPQE